MKNLIISTVLALSFISIHAQAATNLERYFDKARLLTNKDFVFYDSVQFSLFDMSEINLIKPTGFTGEQEKQTKDILKKLPQVFYQNLKAQIYSNEVPVELSNKPQSYSNPLTLSVKIKEVHLKESGNSNQQDVSIKVFFELKDKKTDKVLLQIYDSATSSYLPQTETIQVAFQNMGVELMGDFTEYLHSLY